MVLKLHDILKIYQRELRGAGSGGSGGRSGGGGYSSGGYSSETYHRGYSSHTAYYRNHSYQSSSSQSPSKAGIIAAIVICSLIGCVFVMFICQVALHRYGSPNNYNRFDYSHRVHASAPNYRTNQDITNSKVVRCEQLMHGLTDCSCSDMLRLGDMEYAEGWICDKCDKKHSFDQMFRRCSTCRIDFCSSCEIWKKTSTVVTSPLHTAGAAESVNLDNPVKVDGPPTYAKATETTNPLHTGAYRQ